MELCLVSSRYHKKYTVSWIKIETGEGSLVIQENYQPLIASLVSGSECSFLIDNGSLETVLIKKGIIEVLKESVMILIHER